MYFHSSLAPSTRPRISNPLLISKPEAKPQEHTKSRVIPRAPVPMPRARQGPEGTSHSVEHLVITNTCIHTAASSIPWQLRESRMSAPSPSPSTEYPSPTHSESAAMIAQFDRMRVSPPVSVPQNPAALASATSAAILQGTISHGRPSVTAAKCTTISQQPASTQMPDRIRHSSSVQPLAAPALPPQSNTTHQCRVPPGSASTARARGEAAASTSVSVLSKQSNAAPSTAVSLGIDSGTSEPLWLWDRRVQSSDHLLARGTYVVTDLPAGLGGGTPSYRGPIPAPPDGPWVSSPFWTFTVVSRGRAPGIYSSKSVSIFGCIHCASLTVLIAKPLGSL